jgi:hypothetical protein
MITAIFGWVFLGLLPLAAIFGVIYYMLALPLKREERARFFIGLLEDGMRKGRTAEQTTLRIAASRDCSLGLRFHLVAAYLEGGRTLSSALEQVPGFLSPQLEGVIRAGEESGNLHRVLPACRGMLQDAPYQTRAAYNYLFALLFVLAPIIPALMLVTGVSVLPKLQQVLNDMMEDAAPQSAHVMEMTPYIMSLNITLGEIQFILGLGLALAGAVYLGGPRFAKWIEAGFFIQAFDRLFYLIPWKRKRMHRDFGRMLAILLDAGIPEERALRWAASSTANFVFINRAERSIELLREGKGLTEAINFLDESGEFHWRLTNALHAGKDFLLNLNGWFETLDARAAQQEQAAAQYLTTFLVLMNGLNVAAFMILIVGSLTAIIDQATLW